MTDSDAVAQLRRGDLTGLEELVTRYQDKAVRVVYLIVQDEPLAEDIVVDTFLRIARHIQSFDEDQLFEPYLMRSLVNAALNATRRQHISLDGDEASGRLEELLTTAESLEDLVERNELRLELQNAIASLSPRQRAVIVQRYYLGMNEEEMSAALDAPRGTIKWLLNRARQNLGKMITKQKKD
jgi:RNA polymerase sigma-70 factor (ECF subfamily)